MSTQEPFIQSRLAKDWQDTAIRAVSGLLFLWALSSLAGIAYRATCNVLAFRQARRQHGCKRPARYPHKDWFGFDIIKERQLLEDQGRARSHFDRWFSTLGHTWENTIGGKRVINTINMENIRTVFNADMDTLGRAGSFHKNDFLGPGIFSTDGPRWKFARDMIKPLFKKAEIQSNVMFKKHVDLFISLLPRDGSTIDVQPLLKKLNFDAVAEFVFGKSTDSLVPGSRYSDGQFIEDFNYANAESLKRRQAGRLAFKYYLDREYPRTVAEVHGFVDEQIRLALGEPSTTADEEKDRYVLLEQLAKQIKDPLTLRYECLNIFAGGRDGMAVIVTNALFLLARQPQLWRELREAALPVDEEGLLDFDSKALRPFRNIIYETIRSTGPSATVNRTAFRDTMLPKGGGPDGESPVFVRKGDQISICGWRCNRIEPIWGADACEFVPDRWNNIKMPPEFFPFGGGRRICPAYQQLYVQSAYVLIRLVKEFKSIENRDPVLEYVELDRNLTESRNGAIISLSLA